MHSCGSSTAGPASSEQNETGPGPRCKRWPGASPIESGGGYLNGSNERRQATAGSEAPALLLIGAAVPQRAVQRTDERGRYSRDLSHDPRLIDDGLGKPGPSPFLTSLRFCRVATPQHDRLVNFAIPALLAGRRPHPSAWITTGSLVLVRSLKAKNS